MHKGGNPSFSTYSTSAPSFRKALTSKPIGLFFIRSLPVMTCSPSSTANNAAEKRIAVPAGPMSMIDGRSPNHLTITFVSSQSLTLPTGSLQPDNALIIKARLLILLEEGNITRPAIAEPLTLICITLILCKDNVN